MSAPTVSLLMPNRDNARILELVLSRLAENSTYPGTELVVVDDGSTDGSREILRRWQSAGRFESFQLIEREHGADGVIGALNQGLARCSGDLVVQLDADASIETSGWIERMVAFFGSDERVGVVTGKVVFDWGEIHTCGVDVVGPEGFKARGARISEPAGRRTYHERVSRHRDGECPECDAPAEVDAGAGCCMMFRREAALEVGGYDAGYAPVWFDDVDLTIALRRLGQKVFYLPDVRVIHHIGRRREDESPGRRALAAGFRVARNLMRPGVRHRLADTLGVDSLPAHVRSRLEHHYGYWRQKWGFDLLNPDMEAVLARWGQTELCWRLNPDMRQAGERIVAAYRTDPVVN